MGQNPRYSFISCVASCVVAALIAAGTLTLVAATLSAVHPAKGDAPDTCCSGPTDPGLAAVYAAPKGKTGVSGWPVPVRLSDYPELVEQEPNDEPAKANKVPVPGGISARFGTPKDVDHFAFPGKKGQKLVVSAMTYEVNAPTEVLIRVLDAKGAEVGRSNPAQAGGPLRAAVRAGGRPAAPR